MHVIVIVVAFGLAVTMMQILSVLCCMLFVQSRDTISSLLAFTTLSLPCRWRASLPCLPSATLSRDVSSCRCPVSSLRRARVAPLEQLRYYSYTRRCLRMAAITIFFVVFTVCALSITSCAVWQSPDSSVHPGGSRAEFHRVLGAHSS